MIKLAMVDPYAMYDVTQPYNSYYYFLEPYQSLW